MPKKLTAQDFEQSARRGSYIDSIGLAPTMKTKQGRGRPKTRPVNPKEPSKAQNCRPGESRVTYIVTDETQEKIKRISHHSGASVKEVVNRALSEYVTAYEKKRGTLKPIPNDKLKL